MRYIYRFRNYPLLALGLLGVALCGCTKLPQSPTRPWHRPSLQQLGLNPIQRWRLRKFVAEQSTDHYRCGGVGYNRVSSYLFWAKAASPDYIGLISMLQTSRSHGAVMYFINGQHRITPLDLRWIRCDAHPWQDTTAENNRRREVVEAALRRHANELPDSLQQRIRQFFR